MPRPKKPAAPARKGPGRPRLSPDHERAPAVLVRLCDRSGPALMRYSAEHDGCGIAAAVRQLARAWAESDEVRSAVEAYEHHRKAMARLRAQNEAARAKEAGA